MFDDVVTRGIVTEREAKQAMDLYVSIVFTPNLADGRWLVTSLNAISSYLRSIKNTIISMICAEDRLSHSML